MSLNHKYYITIPFEFSYKTWASGAPDFCGLEKQTVLATDYWNSTLLPTGEHLDKQINVTTKIGNTYLTDDAGDATVRTIDLHIQSKNKDKPMFLYFAPNAVHFPMQGKEEIRDPIVAELTSDIEKPSKLDAFTMEDIVEIIEELRPVLKITETLGIFYANPEF